jgi:hypothetical protein
VRPIGSWFRVPGTACLMMLHAALQSSTRNSEPGTRNDSGAYAYTSRSTLRVALICLWIIDLFHERMSLSVALST